MTCNSEIMCKCVNIEFGSYDNQTNIITPKGNLVGIDNCILKEVTTLWRLGVTTHESCCGHNKAQGYISVDEVSIPIMRRLGYKNQHREDLFYIKS